MAGLCPAIFISLRKRLCMSVIAVGRGHAIRNCVGYLKHWRGPFGDGSIICKNREISMAMTPP
jgi:hypothetical protein